MTPIELAIVVAAAIVDVVYVLWWITPCPSCRSRLATWEPTVRRPGISARALPAILAYPGWRGEVRFCGACGLRRSRPSVDGQA